MVFAALVVGTLFGFLTGAWVFDRPKSTFQELDLVIEIDATKPLKARIRPLKDAEGNAVPWSIAPTLAIVDPDGDALDEGVVTELPDEDDVKVFEFNPGEANAAGKLVASAATEKGGEVTKEIEFTLVAGAPTTDFDIELGDV